jgi:hypothetical protein
MKDDSKFLKQSLQATGAPSAAMCIARRTIGEAPKGYSGNEELKMSSSFELI